MADYVVADTNVITYLTKASKQCGAYQAMLGDRRLAISFQTQAELLGVQFSPPRLQRLRDYLAVLLILRQTEATNVWYSRVAARRAELRRARADGAGASDGDMWVISSALEHGLPLLSHDKQEVHLGRSIRLKVLTNLQSLRNDNPKL